MSGAGNVEDKTNRELIRDANELARHFYKSMGYEVPDDYQFHQATHPQERGCWNLASIAYEFLTDTDLENALAVVEDEDEEQGDDGCRCGQTILGSCPHCGDEVGRVL